MCGGDESRARFGRTTSTGGSAARSQLRNRPLRPVRFYIDYTNPQTNTAGNGLPEIILSKFNNVNYSMEVEQP